MGLAQALLRVLSNSSRPTAMTTRRHFLHTLSVAAAPASALLWSATAMSQPRRRDELTVAFPRPVITLDGNYVDLRENDILNLLTDDALFALHPATGQPQPLAAAEMRLDGPTRVIIKLRPDVRFHDGSMLTADDVAYTLNHAVDEKAKHTHRARLARWLKGAQATAPDTVTLTLHDTYAMVQHDLAMYVKLRKKGTYDKPGAPDNIDPQAQARQLNGTGPYRVVEFRPGERIRLQRFEGYGSRGIKATSPWREITIRIIPDWSTQAAEVMSGGVHWTFGLPQEIAEGAAATRRARLLTGPSMRVFYLSIDATGKSAGAGPFTRVEVRRALNHAINRDGIVKSLIGGTGKAIHAACDPVQFGCDAQDVPRYTYDSSRARTLLAQAGYPNGLDIELWASRDRPIAEVLVANLRMAGIRAQLRYVPGPTLAQARREGKVALEMASSGSFGIPDVGALLPDRLGLGSNRNFSGDDELGKMIGNAQATFDPLERRRRFAAALKRIGEQAYWVPLYVDSQNFLLHPDLQFTQPSDGMPRLWMARWRDALGG
jgi:peptide/nickel transport system substrate-binding protein